MAKYLGRKLDVGAETSEMLGQWGFQQAAGLS